MEQNNEANNNSVTLFEYVRLNADKIVYSRFGIAEFPTFDKHFFSSTYYSLKTK